SPAKRLPDLTTRLLANADFVARLVDLDADADAAIKVGIDDQHLRSVDRHLDLQAPPLGVALIRPHVLVNAVHAFDDDLVRFAVDPKDGRNLALVVAAQYLNDVSLSDVHL